MRPSPYLSACLEVLYRAALTARVIGWSGEKDGLNAQQSAQIADLMDAIHNIQHLLQRWEQCDEGLLRSFLDIRYQVERNQRWAAGCVRRGVRHRVT